MDLALSEFQQKTRETARGFLAANCPKSLLRELESSETGHSPDLWRRMAELGWLGLGVPGEHGGLGGSLIDLAVIVEEMGYAAYASPFITSSVVAARLLSRHGAREQRASLLPRIADGSSVATVAIAEEPGGWNAGGIGATLGRHSDRYVLNGEKRFVDYAASADQFIVFALEPGIAGEDGVSAVLVAPDAGATELVDMKATAGREYAVRFTNLELSDGRVVGPGDAAARALNDAVQTATAMQCAFSVGVAQRALDMTVEHAKERSQFGQPLGKFQAVQHMCADIAMLAESSRLITYEALWRLEEDLEAPKAVAMAKAFTNEATRNTLWMAHQVHGGVGIMREYDLHFYFRLAKATELKLGISRDHYETVADALGLMPR